MHKKIINHSILPTVHSGNVVARNEESLNNLFPNFFENIYETDSVYGNVTLDIEKVIYTDESNLTGNLKKFSGLDGILSICTKTCHGKH